MWWCVSCGAQPSSGAVCATKSPVAFAQWSTGVWACNWCTWCAALQHHLVYPLWVANGHFRSCVLLSIFASNVALRPRASNTPSRSWAKVRFPRFFDCEWRWNGGTSWRGLDLALSRGIWSPAWRHHLCFWPGWLQLISTYAPACVLLVASRLYSSSRAELLQMALWMRPSAEDCSYRDATASTTIDACVLICVVLLAQTFAPEHALADVKRAVSLERLTTRPGGSPLVAHHCIILPRATPVFFPLA